MICPSCRTENSAESHFCSRCGSGLFAAGDTPALGGASPPSSPHASQETSSAPAVSPTAVTAGAVTPSDFPSASGYRVAGGAEWVPDFGPRYQVEGKVGEGGMGTVYRARDLELDRTVALKLLRPELIPDPAAVLRFKQELLLASKVSHKHILRIHDLGDAGGIKFISMAFVEGEDLHQLLVREGKLSTARAVKIARQLCAALEAAHSEQVIHRDLKPQNILVDKEDQIFVSDFGLAKSVATDATAMTLAGQVLGTPQYMSPEQVEGQELDARSDLYAVGLILYEMVTGDLPFSGNSAMQIALQRVRQDPPDPKVKNPEVPDYLARIILRCLARNRAQRYQSAREILQDLDAQQASAMPRVPPPSQVDMPAEETAPAKSHGPWRWVVLSMVSAVFFGIIFPWLSRTLAPSDTRTQETATSTRSKSATTYVAVLPFKLMSDDPKLSYVADGLSEALPAKLSAIRHVRVSSAAAAQKIKPNAPLEQVARELGVETVIQGFVQASGDNLSVVVKVYRAKGPQVPNQEFSGVRQDLLTVEDNIYSKLVDLLALKPDSDDATRVQLQRPTEKIDAYDAYLRGRAAVKGGRSVDDLKKALEFYNQAVQKDPAFALAYAGMTDAHMAIYRINKDNAEPSLALGAAQRAASLSDNQPEVYIALSAVYNQTGKGAEAAAELKHALELAPNSDDGWARLGDIYVNSGDKSKAIEAYQKAIELNPYYWGHHYVLGQAYSQFGDTGLALKEFQKTLEIDPQNADAYNGIGTVYSMEGKFQDAIPAYKKAIELEPYYLTYSNLGLDYYYLKQYPDAAATLEKAVQLNSGDERVMGNLGDAYRALGDQAKAHATYERAIQLALSDLRVNPRQASTMGHLAQYYAKKGDSRKAMGYIQKARAIDVNDVDLIATQVIVQTLAGKSSDALKTLRVALQRGYPVDSARAEPELKRLQGLPEFEALLKEFEKKSS